MPNETYTVTSSQAPFSIFLLNFSGKVEENRYLKGAQDSTLLSS